MLRRRTVLVMIIPMIASIGFALHSNPTHKSPMKKYTKAQIERGAYLVNTVGGCNDCHTPKRMTPQGPVLDTDNLLSGHPSSQSPDPIPNGVLSPDGWGFLGTAGFTSYAGPWGISFAANITPDSATGIGSWTEEMFIDCLRNGRFWGSGRPLLPPMPWQGLSHMTDSDLADMYAYLMSIKPVYNTVPSPIPPDKAFQN